MKLKNKKTGEIKECVVIPVDSNGYPNEYQVFEKGESLAELNDEWEDYEEPKDFYVVEQRGIVGSRFSTDAEYVKKFKKIGNYFETREEAEKAVEKLKAWKRLKDKGFRFIDHIDRDSGQGMTRYEWDGYINGEDLDLLFGGEK